MAKKKSKLSFRSILFFSAAAIGVAGWSGYDNPKLVSARDNATQVITNFKEKFEALRDSVQEQYEALTGGKSSRK